MLTSSSRLRDFPSLEGITYLNTAAESIPPLAVGAAINEYSQHKCLGMAGRDHHFDRVEQCREISAKFLNLTPSEIGFCSCSSEAYNLLASALDLRTGDEVVVTDLDFPAGVTPWMSGGKEVTMRLWQHRDGVLELEDLKDLLNEKTQLVQISLVSFYNGYRIPWAPLRDAVRALAPQAIIAVDITQALGRVELDCLDADILISSTHKWTLGVHGGCIVGVPAKNAERLTTRAGGWYHISNAFDADRFEEVHVKTGAVSYSVGMPNFAALYALNAALRYVDAVGISAITAQADPLIKQVYTGLVDLGLKPMAPHQAGTGILAFKHDRASAIHAALLEKKIHTMHSAGRIRIAAHGYNTSDDVEVLLGALEAAL